MIYNFRQGSSIGTPLPQPISVCNIKTTKQGLPWSLTQWLTICLPIQGTRVRALVQEDPKCRGATKPVSHNY